MAARRAGGALALLAACLLALACGQDGAAGKAPRHLRAGGDPPQATPTPKAPSGPLLVYSSRHEGLVAPLVAAFSKKTGVSVFVRYGGTQEMVDRLLAEGTRTPAAAFLAPNAAALGQLSRRGLLHELPMDLVQQVPLRFAGVPAKHDWVGLCARARVVVYDPTRTRPDALPKSLEEAGDEKYRGRWGFAPATGTFRSQVALYPVLDREGEVEPLLRRLRDGQPHVYAANDDVVDAVARGEIDWGLTNHDAVVRALRRDPQAHVAAFLMPDGDTASLVNVTAIGVLQDDPRALELVRFLLSKDAQATLARDTGEYALAGNLPPPAGLPPLAQVRTPDIDYSDIGAVLAETDRSLRKVGLLASPEPESERVAAGASSAEGESAGEEAAAPAPAPSRAKATATKGKHASRGRHAAAKPKHVTKKGKAPAKKKAAPTHHRRKAKKKPGKPPE